MIFEAKGEVSLCVCQATRAPLSVAPSLPKAVHQLIKPRHIPSNMAALAVVAPRLEMQDAGIVSREGYPGSNIKDFELAVRACTSLLEGINPPPFHSPYSVVPAISQLLGVPGRLTCSSDSPYCVDSKISPTGENRQILKKVLDIPLPEREKIVDDIYDLMAPSLLRD